MKPEGAIFGDASTNYLQLARIVEGNRAASNLDRIVSNKGAMTYECVWGKASDNSPWPSAYVCEVGDWNALAEASLSAADCLGFYVLDELPPSATVGIALA